MRCELSIGRVSGSIITHVSEAKIESLLRFDFFLIVEVDFGSLAGCVVANIVIASHL